MKFEENYTISSVASVKICEHIYEHTQNYVIR